MRHIGKDSIYTEAMLSKRAVEIAEQELHLLIEWAQDTPLPGDTLIDHLYGRIEMYKDLIEEKFYAIEMLRRDSDNHHHQMVSPRGVHITDHAVVRYLQRVMGVDLKEMAKNIVPAAAEKLIKELKNGRVILEDTVIVFKNSVVVTILSRGMSRKYRMKTIDLRSRTKRKKQNRRPKRRSR